MLPVECRSLMAWVGLWVRRYKEDAEATVQVAKLLQQHLLRIRRFLRYSLSKGKMFPPMFSSGMRSEAETVTCETRFGSFKGRKGDGVVTFRGIRYASFRSQLSSPELVTEYGSEVVDAVEFGYV